MIVRPENTAIVRSGSSKPLRDAVARGWVKPSDGILDFGCGRGADEAWLLANGYDAVGYDVHVAFGRSHRPARRFDVVLVIYVVNVLGSVDDRLAALRDAWGFVRPGGALYVVSRDDRTIATEAAKGGWARAPDAFWSNQARGMLQRGHSVDELVALTASLRPTEVLRSPERCYAAILVRKPDAGWADALPQK